MSVNLEAIRQEIETEYLATVAAIAADGSVAPKAVKAAMLGLGVRFDKEFGRAKAKLRLAAVEAEMPALRAAMDAACVLTEAAHKSREETETRHRTEKEAAEIEFRDKWMKSNQAQRVVNDCEYKIRDLTVEVNQP